MKYKNTFGLIVALSMMMQLSKADDAPLSSDAKLESELEWLKAEKAGQVVYSASKKMQHVNDVAAAISVISQEDIRRAGVTSIPEALRMVPGLQVAQIDSNKWAVSARGFNDRYSDKLLVMIDGRTVYTPIFSGVFWQREDTLLEDIERIEVIRGAGAAMWGSNAVNGVINIITKNAKDTQGALLTGGGGNQEQGFGSVRYGDKVGDDFYYRLYAKGFKRNNNKFSETQNAQDDWENYQGGFKTEWDISKEDTLTTQGDIYNSRTGNREDFALPYPPFVLKGQDVPAQHNGGNIQTRWKHKISETSETSLQVYYKHDNSTWNFVTPWKMKERTIDVDFQHRFIWLDDHDTIWGLGYRYYNFTSNQNVKVTFNPTAKNLQLFSAFLQDDYTLLKDELKLTVGARLEHNDFTGFEIQPNARLLWIPDKTQSLWAAFSRAVRIPTLVSHNLESIHKTVPSNLPLPAVASIQGSPDMIAETVLDYELGYRIQATRNLSFDVTGFYNQYKHLQATEILPANVSVTSGTPYIEIPLQISNKMTGETIGVELTTHWYPTDWLKMQASYWLLKTSLHTPKEFTFINGELIEKHSPQQQFHFKTSFNLPYNFELDTMLRYVDTVPRYQIQDYVALDMRLGWRPVKNIELSLVAQNLLDNQHSEMGDNVSELPKIEIQRSIFGKIAISF